MRVRCGQTRKVQPKRPNKTNETEERAGRRQVFQLAVCVALFLLMFIGKGAFPDRVAQVGPQLLGVIRSNTDFRAAFAALGGAMADSEGLPEGVRDFCVAVFGIQGDGPENRHIAGTETVEVLQPASLQQEEPESMPEPEPEHEPEPEMPRYQIGDVVETFAVEGQELPENYTYNNLYLGEMETADPVEGKLTSAFGYRDHPTIGTYAVHGGVDIGAAKGTTVRAFADGTVEYVGENDDFGLYLRLSHEHGISTFYSHCQSIEVEKGQRIQVGQPVATVGSTGKSTGPHLHFEVQLGEVRLDPLHYISLENK